MHFKQTRPHDRLDPVYRPNSSGDERTHWKMKCLDWSVPSHAPSSGIALYVVLTETTVCFFVR